MVELLKPVLIHEEICVDPAISPSGYFIRIRMNVKVNSIIYDGFDLMFYC